MQVGAPLHFDPMVHNEVCQQDDCNVTSEKQKASVDKQRTEWHKGRGSCKHAVPVEWYSRGISLRQIVHQRRPAASRWRKGKRLWPIVIHHFQAPVSIQWHRVTWRRDRDNQKCTANSFKWRCKDFSLTLLFFVGSSRAAAVARF